MVWTSLFHLYTSSFNLLSLHFFFHRDSQRIRLQGWQVSLISLFLLLEMLGSSLFPLVISGVLNLILSFSTTYLMGRIYGYSKTSSLFWACIFQEANIFIESSLAFLLFQVWGLPPIQTLPSVFLYTSLLIGLGFLLVFSLRKFVLVKLPDIELKRMTRLKILLIPIISSLAISCSCCSLGLPVSCCIKIYFLKLKSRKRPISAGFGRNMRLGSWRSNTRGRKVFAPCIMIGKINCWFSTPSWQSSSTRRLWIS